MRALAACRSDEDNDANEKMLTYPLPPCTTDIVTLIRRDVSRLKPERYLNDNLIDYYFKYGLIVVLRSTGLLSHINFS